MYACMNIYVCNRVRHGHQSLESAVLAQSPIIDVQHGVSQSMDGQSGQIAPQQSATSLFVLKAHNGTE